MKRIWKVFLPKKLEELQDIEVQGRYFRAFSLQKDGEIVQIVRDITAEEGMLNTLFLILVIGCSIGKPLCDRYWLFPSW